MNIKSGADPTDVHPILWAILGAIALKHRIDTGHELVVTSLRRPPGPRKSLHSPEPGELCAAADIRRWVLDRTHSAETFARKLQHEYGLFLGVVVEPEWLTPEEITARGGFDPANGHIHVELKTGTWPPGL